MNYSIIIVLFFSIISQTSCQPSQMEERHENTHSESVILSDCDFDVVKKVNQQLPSISDSVLTEFIQTLSVQCHENAEFTEFSNEVLWRVLENNPKLFFEIWNKNYDTVDNEAIMEIIKNPIHDSIDHQPVNKMLEDFMAKRN